MFLDVLGEKFERYCYFWGFSLVYIVYPHIMADQMYYLGNAWMRLTKTFTKQNPAVRTNIPQEVMNLDTFTLEEHILTTRDVIVWIVLAYFVLIFGVVLCSYFCGFTPTLTTQTTLNLKILGAIMGSTSKLVLKSLK